MSVAKFFKSQNSAKANQFINISMHRKPTHIYTHSAIMICVFDYYDCLYPI